MVAVLLLTSACRGASVDNWPELRGPTRDGHSTAQHLPLSWSETNHVVWKTAIHDLGSGKVVHGVKVFENPEPQHVAASTAMLRPHQLSKQDVFMSIMALMGLPASTRAREICSGAAGT